MRVRSGSASLALAAGVLAASTASIARPADHSFDFDLPAQPLDAALQRVAAMTGRQIIIAAQQASGKTAPPLKGNYDADRAVKLLLTGSGISANYGAAAILVGQVDPVQDVSAIVVTGTRIRGGHVASPVISISRQEMLDGGRADLGEVVRDIPQSFGGGQNPNVVSNTPGLQNQNFNAASTINLRGLGPDATLTLINGHRIAYDGASQAVDISSIPVAAIDRLEIVADGSSAIYGSDAVGGVANIILRKDYDGLEAGARLGGATDGGDFQQQYDVVTGKKWSSGGFIATYNFERNTAITAADRSYTSDIDGSTTLTPFMRQHSGILSGHQSLTDDISFTVDATFNHRLSLLGYPSATNAPYLVDGVAKSQATTSYSVAPTVNWQAPLGWLLSASGVYGWDRTNFDSTYYTDAAYEFSIPGHYRDTSKIAELSAEGPLFSLPGGAARLALGAGYRDVTLRGFGQFVMAGSSETLIDYNYGRKSRYGYGELYLPIVEPAQGITGLARLEVTAALRYESYDQLGHDATPKFGLVYAPIEGLTLKGTWARSFKTPTLYQQYSGYSPTLYSASDLGASGSSPNATVMDLSGGNPNLKSERATNWTAGFQFKPEWINGLKMDVSYFDIHYKDRINDVGVSLNNILSNSAYQSLITRNPTIAQITALIDGAAFPLTNLSETSFDPANVIAIVDERYLNVSSQTLRGVDLALSYDRKLTETSSLSVNASATYLQSSQRLLPGADAIALAGAIYNPPHWRARGGATWRNSRWALSGYLNYVGPVTDNVTLPDEAVGSMTTVDLTASYTIDAGRWLSGTTVGLIVENLFNAKPALVRESVATQPAYDSTNYSAVGRVIGFTLTKRM